MANKYWSPEEILKVNATYYMLLGPRGVGKSYSVTNKILEWCFKTSVIVNAYKYDNYMFGYLRRYAMDVKTDNVSSYFADIDVAKLTNGEWNAVMCKRGWIYFVKINEEDEYDITWSRKIGKVFALASAEHYKSLKYPDISDIIFEEFVTDNIYLQNEPDKLMELISTILRDRPGRVWLIGNTLSRVCPYFTEWGLDCVRDLEAGEIKVIDVHGVDSKGNDYTTKIAVEMCVADKANSGMFFGQRGKSISGAEVWTGGRHPKLPGSYRFDYELLYEFELRDFNFSFVVQELMQIESGNLVVYIYPKTRDREIERVITTEFSIERLTSPSLRDTIKAEKNIRSLINEKKYCFNNDRTGDDFEHVLENREAVL